MAVAEEENISAAARKLGLSQPTVSRYLQLLERWLGKKLVDPGRVHDPENPGTSVGLTEEGLNFAEIAEAWLETLTNFRTVEARSQEELTSMRSMVSKMSADLTGGSPSKAALRERKSIEILHRTVDNLNEEAPLEILVTIKKRLWRTFSAYEAEKLLEKRKSRVRSRGPIDPKRLRVDP